MQKERPLSPHLQVYKPQMTSVLSIIHRGSGVFLALSAPVLVYWLWSIAAGAQTYNDLQACFSHWLCRLFLLGWTFALFYHLCNGIRHLFWDIGKGYELKSLYTSGKLVLVFSVVLTIAAWVIAYSHQGGV